MLIRFALWRLLLMLPSLLGLMVMVFVLIRVVPNDPAVLLAGPTASAEQVQEIRHKHGFDQPITVQLYRYVAQLGEVGLGHSIFTGRPVAADILAALPATLELTLVALALAVVIGIALGAVAASQYNRMIDFVIRISTVAGLALASFWFAILLQLLFSMELGWLPLSGRLDPDLERPAELTGLLLIDSLIGGRFEVFVDALAHLVLPAVTLAIAPCATIARFVRSGMVETLQKDFVHYEEAMGYPRFRIIGVYALRNSVVAAVTQIGLLFGALMGGAVAIEYIYDWPGIGSYAVRAVLDSDYNAILAVTLLIGVVYAIVNILVDIALALIDPRVGDQL